MMIYIQFLPVVNFAFKQGHRLTIKQLQDTLSSNKLKFLGFLLPKQIKSLYKNYFPED